MVQWRAEVKGRTAQEVEEAAAHPVAEFDTLVNHAVKHLSAGEWDKACPITLCEFL